MVRSERVLRWHAVRRAVGALSAGPGAADAKLGHDGAAAHADRSCVSAFKERGLAVSNAIVSTVYTFFSPNIIWVMWCLGITVLWACLFKCCYRTVGSKI